MLVFVAALVLLGLVILSRREGFSVTVKADGGALKALGRGAQSFVREATSKVSALPATAISMVPFRHTFRQWHRTYFKKNIGLVYA